MSFLLIPAEAPARIVHGHPPESLLYDSIGEAVPVPLTISHQLTGFWLRETCVAEGLARNPVAAVMARSMGGALGAMTGPRGGAAPPPARPRQAPLGGRRAGADDGAGRGNHVPPPPEPGADPRVHP